MPFLSASLARVKPSATIAVTDKARALKAAGRNVIGLGAGEPDFDTPANIKLAAIRAIEAGKTKYTDVGGIPELKEAIIAKFQRENGLTYKPNQIIVGTGGKQVLYNALMATINPGDEVIIPTPAWVSYVQMVNLAGGTNVLVPAGIDQDFKITPQQLRDALTPKTRMIILCSPSNPTGSVYSRSELKALAEVLADYPDVLVVADEIYEHINYIGGHESIAQFDCIKDRVAIINGVSKAYAMTGWRIGYIAAPLWLAKAITKLQGQYTSGASSIAQKAAEAAYTGPQDCVETMRKAFERRRDLMVKMLGEIPGVNINVPQGAFYVFPEVKSFFGKRCGDVEIKDAGDLALYLLNEAHVATVSGDAFCCPGHIRMSYATSDDNLREAATRIKAALAKLQ